MNAKAAPKAKAPPAAAPTPTPPVAPEAASVQTPPVAPEAASEPEVATVDPKAPELVVNRGYFPEGPYAVLISGSATGDDAAFEDRQPGGKIKKDWIVKLDAADMVNALEIGCVERLATREKRIKEAAAAAGGNTGPATEVTVD